MAAFKHCSVVQVLDGYIFLGSAETLGREVVGAFSSAVNTATLKVVSLQCCSSCLLTCAGASVRTA